MYKIISKSRYSTTFTIVDRSGNEIPVTLPRNQSTYSQKITSSIRNLQTQGVLIVRLSEPKLSTGTQESGGLTEKITIHKTPESIYDFLISKSLNELKELARSLHVIFGNNIGKPTLTNRLIDQRSNEIYAMMK